MRASGQRAFRRAVLGLSLLAQLLCCSGQGLATTTNTRGTLSKAYERITKYTQGGASFRRAYLANPQAACRLNRRSLCGAAAGTDDYVKLQVACSPTVYDARTDAGPNFNPIGPAKDQRPCQTAVAFAVTAAAEAAVASAVQINGSSISLSQQDLQFCPGIPRGCYENWNLEAGLERLVNETVVDYECLPYTAAQSDDPAKLCNYRCTNKPKALVPGKFGYTPIRDVISAQKQVRRYGSFVTRFNLYDDFFPWVSKTAASNPDAVYECPNTNKPAVDGHVVTVIGYNNDQGYWIVKNSWGPDNGNKGFFKVKYGVCGMMLIGDTYGVFFVPEQQRRLVMSAVAPSTGKGQKCYFYQGQKGDTLSKIADSVVVNLGQLLFDNIKVVRDLNKPLAGLRIRICNPDPASVKLPRATQPASTPGGNPAKAAGARVGAATPADAAVAGNTAPNSEVAPESSGASPASDSSEPSWGLVEAKILLDFKASLGDPPGLNWAQGTQPCGDSAAGVPVWNQVYCSTYRQQQRVYLLDLSSLGLTGSLDAMSDLSELNRLQGLWLSGNQLSGPLPASWSKFKNLREVKLDMNALTGSLPEDWGKLTRIRRIYLNGNRLSGTLPDAWGEMMSQLQSLFLASNTLQGTVPASWAQMTNLTAASLYDNPGLTGCLPFDWNAKAERVKLASGPASTDGAKTLSLSGTCLCGYCKDQLSTSCEWSASITPQCAAAAAAAGGNTSASSPGPNTSVGSGARIAPAAGGVEEPGPETADSGIPAGGATANGSAAAATAPTTTPTATPPGAAAATTAPAGTALPGPAAVGTAAGSTTPTSTAAGSVPTTAAGAVTPPIVVPGAAVPAAGAAGTVAPTVPVTPPTAGATVAPVTPGAAATTPAPTTPVVTAPVAGVAGTVAPAPGSTIPASSTVPTGGAVPAGSTPGGSSPGNSIPTPPGIPGAVPPTTLPSPAPGNGPTFGAVKPTGVLSDDEANVALVSDTRNPTYMSVEESNAPRATGTVASNTSR